MKNAFGPSPRSTSATYLIPQAHWDAMADILGEDECARLYGARPELVNTSQSVERLYFNDRAPRRAMWVAVVLAAVVAGTLSYAAYRKPAERPTAIEPCAMILTRESGPECR